MSEGSPTLLLPQIREDISGGGLEEDTVTAFSGYQSVGSRINDVARPGDILGMIEAVEARAEVARYRRQPVWSHFPRYMRDRHGDEAERLAENGDMSALVRLRCGTVGIDPKAPAVRLLTDQARGDNT